MFYIVELFCVDVLDIDFVILEVVVIIEDGMIILIILIGNFLVFFLNVKFIIIEMNMV